MGDALGGVFGSGGKTTTDNKIDPQSEALNKIRLTQLSTLFEGSPYADFAKPQSDIYTGSPAVDNLFKTASTPSTVPQSVAPNDYSNLMSLDDYKKMGLDEGSNYISQVAQPEIMQTAALQGLERGGFVAEAIAKATAGIAMPFLSTLPGASTSLTLAKPQAEAARAGTNLTNAQTALTGPQGNLLNAQRATALFPLADYQRALSEQDFLRQQGVVTTGLTGLPFTPVTDSTQKKSSQPFFNFFGQG